MNIPNFISFFRIIVSPVLLLLMNSTSLFISLYLIVGLSDIADGYIARKYNMVTPKGAMLDSFADLVFYAAVLMVLCLKYEWIINENLFLILTILVIKGMSIIVSKIKFKKIVFIHTITNKITGLLIFIAIPLIMFGISRYVIVTLFVIAIFSALEEFLIIISNKNINLNQKSLFVK